MGSLTPKPRLFCRLRFAQHLQAYVGLLSSAASATALRASLSPVRFPWGFRKPSCTGRSAPRPPRGLGFAAAAPTGTGVRPVQSVASVSAASALQSSAGPGGRSRCRQVSWERNGVGQTEGSHSHRKHRANESCGTSLPQLLGYALFPSFPQATPSANSGPCPLALQAVTRQEPVTLVSLLQLREVGVQVHWVRLLSMQPERLPLPARSRSGLLPLQSPSSSCSLTKRAFLREKPSPWPSLHVDQHLSQLLGVGLVNRLPPGLVPMCLHTWGRCPTPASGAGAQPELWSPNSSPDLESPEGVSSVRGTSSFSVELRVPGLRFQPTQRVTTACSPRQLVLVAGSPPISVLCFISLFLHPTRPEVWGTFSSGLGLRSLCLLPTPRLP